MTTKTRIEELTIEDIVELNDLWSKHAHDRHHILNRDDGYGFMDRLLGGVDAVRSLFETPIDISAELEAFRRI